MKRTPEWIVYMFTSVQFSFQLNAWFNFNSFPLLLLVYSKMTVQLYRCSYGRCIITWCFRTTMWLCTWTRAMATTTTTTGGGSNKNLCSVLYIYRRRPVPLRSAISPFSSCYPCASCRERVFYSVDDTCRRLDGILLRIIRLEIYSPK